MKLTAKIKGFFKKEVKIESESMHDLVEKLKWAEVEVEDTKDALLGLQMRLMNGVVVMEDIIKDAQEIIDHHKAVLDKAVQRKNEFNGHVAQVKQAMNIMDSIYQN